MAACQAVCPVELVLVAVVERARRTSDPAAVVAASCATVVPLTSPLAAVVAVAMAAAYRWVARVVRTCAEALLTPWFAAGVARVQAVLEAWETSTVAVARAPVVTLAVEEVPAMKT